MFIYLGLTIIALCIVAICYLLFSKKQPKPITVKVEKPAIDPLIPIQIYFGSQQGTAAKYAKILAEEGNDYGFITNDVDLNEVNFEQEMTEGKVGIFCIATHGEGDPTDNAKKFAEFLQEPRKSLKGFRYCVFGFGNTQYEHYNKMGRLTNNKLEENQGIKIYKYGEGDDNASLEEDFNAWKKGIWEELKVQLKDLIDKSKAVGNQQDKPQVPIHHGATYQLEIVKEDEVDINTHKEGQYDFQTKQFLNAKECQILQIKELRQNNDDGSTLHIILDTGSSGLTYKTAMNLAVFPENNMNKVQEVAEMLGEDLNTVYHLKEAVQQKRPKLPFPSPLRVETILQKFCDFSGQIMKKTLKDLSLLTDDLGKKQKQISDKYERLEYLSSSEGKIEFTNTIEHQKKTIIEILQENGIKVNLAQFIELCPRISPRLFTIASSNLKSPNNVHLIDSLLSDKLPNGQIKVGLCSQYFLNCKNQMDLGQKVNVRVDFRESSFKLPDNQNTSILMIGPGTGIAPFIGFLEEREVFLQNQQQKLNKYLLYFGCRHQKGDFIYKEQIIKYQENKTIDQLFLAFSRDQGEKIYVQDLLKKESQSTLDMIDKDQVVIYICGSTQMGKCILQTLTDILQINRSLEEAQNKIQDMEKNKIIIKELW